MMVKAASDVIPAYLHVRPVPCHEPQIMRRDACNLCNNNFEKHWLNKKNEDEEASIKMNSSVSLSRNKRTE